ncbi:DUF5959 family protein [Streptomyces sp. NPDC047917]|uniref:DUF5959 family protein n=1 Tax=Streptomyces sp. NPDC047917 TaxID=3365491 RepID=UPI00371720BB
MAGDRAHRGFRRPVPRLGPAHGPDRRRPQQLRRLRSPEIRIEIDRQFPVPVPVVTVTDDNDSASSVRVWLDVGHGWADDLRKHYEQVRRAWPNKVVASPRSTNFWQ